MLDEKWVAPSIEATAPSYLWAGERMVWLSEKHKEQQSRVAAGAHNIMLSDILGSGGIDCRHRRRRRWRTKMMMTAIKFILHQSITLMATEVKRVRSIVRKVWPENSLL